MLKYLRDMPFTFTIANMPWKKKREKPIWLSLKKYLNEEIYWLEITVRNPEWILTTDVLAIWNRIFVDDVDSFQSYPNASNRAPDCISPSFFCLSVSPFPSIPVATSTNPRGTHRDLGFTDLRRATSKWNTLLWGTVYIYICSSRSPRRIRQIRYFAFSLPAIPESQ